MSQFGDAGTWPREINQATAEYIVLNALCEYFGGDALEEQRPDDLKVEEALNNMESLAYCLSNMSGWEGLLSAIDRRVEAIRNGMLMHKEKPEGRRVKVILDDGEEVREIEGCGFIGCVVKGDDGDRFDCETAIFASLPGATIMQLAVSLLNACSNEALGKPEATS